MSNSDEMTTNSSALNLLINQALDALNAHRNEEALTCATQALTLAPNHPLAILVIGLAQQHLKMPQALQTLAHAVTLAPDNAMFRYNYAVSLNESGHEELAMVEYRACLDINPSFNDALWNYGEMLRMQNYFTQALRCFDHLYSLEKTMRPSMAHRMAVCCAYLGLHQRADELFKEAIAMPSEEGAALSHWEYALYLLGQSRFKEAWPHFAQRFEAGKKISVFKAPFPYPDWQGIFEENATLIVSGEQGAGDEVLFSAFIPPLLATANAYKMRIIIACQSSLARLFEASFPQAIIVARTDNCLNIVEDLVNKQPTWHIAMGDLPLWIEKPTPKAYLKPNADDIKLAREFIAEKPSTLKKVGLIWAANPQVTRANRQNRNIPPHMVNNWLSPLQNIQFYSLQHHEHRSALAKLSSLPIRDMSHILTDFSKTAAVMSEMDFILSVCTSTANLAGALGLDTHVMLQKNGDWRWHNDTAWFPKITTYRQVVDGDWANLLQSIFTFLNKLKTKK